MDFEILVSFLWTSFHITKIITPSVTVIAGLSSEKPRIDLTWRTNYSFYPRRVL